LDFAIFAANEEIKTPHKQCMGHFEENSKWHFDGDIIAYTEDILTYDAASGAIFVS